jgi:gliding motility-associated-like protein
MKKIFILFSFLLAQLSFSQSDCGSAIPVCGNSAISYTPTGPGSSSETLGGCLSTEHYSVWYSFTIATSGTLTFLITPNAQADYDWAVYGPNVTCATKGTPIRCSYASTASGILTGLNMTATDTTENAGGDGFCQYMDVVAGQTYYMIVDNFSANTNGFQLSWGGTATLASPFNDPTIQPNPFVAPGPNNNGVILICAEPTIFDFSTLSTGIINGNPNFNVSYYYNSNNAITNTNPITTPISVNTTTTYYYAVYYTDPTNPNNPINQCREYGTIDFDSGAITVNNPTILACNDNNQGIGTFDLTSAPVYTDPTATVVYYLTMADLTAGTNPITNLSSFVSPATQVFAQVTTVQGCTNTATVTLDFIPLLPVSSVTLTACNNNHSGQAAYDLTTANVYTDPNAPKKYYPTLNDLLNDTNEITTPALYISAQGQVYVEVTGAQNCKNYATITLQFYPSVQTQEATLTECFLAGTPTVSEFDLTTANITTAFPNTKTFYPSYQDAVNDTNSIANPNVYSSNSTAVFARVYGADGCWNIAQINLKVTPPTYSSLLLDKIICVEGRTTLDAGPGFQAYQWSTGETTQVISNVGVGEYWVDLNTDGCVTRQTVKVYASPSPVITNIDITNNTVTVTATGGTLPYQFSLDNINWQDSNVFTSVPRGQASIYVKDAYDCDPSVVEITVPNLVNAITPNDDNVNDYLDYSALGYKKDVVLTVYDRYGTKIHVGDKTNMYQWDGRTGNKKVETGTYWYTITWSDPVTKVPSQYSGWILVKNRD